MCVIYLYFKFLYCCKAMPTRAVATGTLLKPSYQSTCRIVSNYKSQRTKKFLFSIVSIKIITIFLDSQLYCTIP